MSVFAFKIKVLIYRRAGTTSIFSSFQRRWCRQCSELTRSQNPSTSMPYLGAYFTIYISPHRSRTLSSSRVMFLTRVNRSRKLPAKKKQKPKAPGWSHHYGATATRHSSAERHKAFFTQLRDFFFFSCFRDGGWVGVDKRFSIKSNKCSGFHLYWRRFVSKIDGLYQDVWRYSSCRPRLSWARISQLNTGK